MGKTTRGEGMTMTYKEKIAHINALDALTVGLDFLNKIHEMPVPFNATKEEILKALQNQMESASFNLGKMRGIMDRTELHE